MGCFKNGWGVSFLFFKKKIDLKIKIINLIKSKDYKGALIEIENYSDSSYPYNNNPILLYYLAFIKNRLNEKEKVKINSKDIWKKNSFGVKLHASRKSLNNGKRSYRNYQITN